MGSFGLSPAFQRCGDDKSLLQSVDGPQVSKASLFSDFELVAMYGSRQDRGDFVRFFFAAADDATDAGLSYDEIVFGETFVSIAPNQHRNPARKRQFL